MYDLSLSEILASNSSQLYKDYVDELDKLKNNRITKQIVEEMYGASINQIYEAILLKEAMNISNDSDFFPGDLVLLHDGIKEYHSETNITCYFSAAPIKKGELYLNYRPILENLTTKRVYVLNKSIKVETSYYDLLPTNMMALEELNYKMKLQVSDDGIDYSHFNQVMGGTLSLRRLKK